MEKVLSILDEVIKLAESLKQDKGETTKKSDNNLCIGKDTPNQIILEEQERQCSVGTYLQKAQTRLA